MKTVVIVFGTRPEAIKMCPLVLEFKKNPNFKTHVIVTGQHLEMLNQVLHIFNIVPDVNMAIMKKGQSLFDVTTEILLGIKEYLIDLKPDILLVHGDTTTTFAAALAAFYLRIPVGHVEAGLRTGNISSPFPEEFNRASVSIISKYNFVPTNISKDNLLKEGKDPKSIFVTGNTVIDALKTTVQVNYHHNILDWVNDDKLVLVTAHRRENIGEPMINMFKAIRRVCDENNDIKIVYPVHLNPQVQEIAQKILGGHPRIRLIEPLNVIDFHNFIARSHIILTDSGGIQEEAPTFGVPVLVMRDTTERPEGIDAGTLKLVGNTEEGIYNAFKLLISSKDEYSKMHNSTNPYGDGNSSERIVKIIENELIDNINTF